MMSFRTMTPMLMALLPLRMALAEPPTQQALDAFPICVVSLPLALAQLQLTWCIGE